MRLPQFTAEIGLRKSSEFYVGITVARSRLVRGETVAPAAPPQFNEGLLVAEVKQDVLCNGDCWRIGGQCRCLALKLLGD